MANRKATFAKRQREMDLKDHAKAKEGRRMARRASPKDSKGPEIAWDSVFVPEAPVPGEIVDAPPATPADAASAPSPTSTAANNANTPGAPPTTTPATPPRR